LPRRITVDAEHFGIRLLLPLLFIGGLVGGYTLGSRIIHQFDPALEGACLGIPFAVILSLLLIQFGEHIIKPLWKSGRYLELSETTLRIVDQRRNRQDKEFSLNQDLLVTGWYFAVPTRKNRVPKGWYCTSWHLQQGDDEAVIYTFLNPQTADAFPDFKAHFVELTSTKKKDAVANLQDARLLALQKRLRELENKRWSDGAEINSDDFLAISEALTL
jgi:hypothetical protein